MFNSTTKQPARGFVPLKYPKFGDESNVEEDEQSGVITPPLWRKSPDHSPQHHGQNNYRCLSPRSKTEAIARGQKELMDMVSNMPDSCYELSLKDIVQKKPNLDEDEDLLYRNEVNKRVVNNSMKRVERRGLMMNRSDSLESGGLLLKMFFPVSFGAKKGKKNDKLWRNSFSKDGVNVKSGNVEDKDCWKKRPSFAWEGESGQYSINGGSSKSIESSSSGSSTGTRSNSNGSTRSNSNGSTNNKSIGSSIRNEGSGVQPSCWSFIISKNSKMTE